MEAGDTETDLAVNFEAAGGREEAEVRGLERVCGWECDSAVVQTTGVG
jgi:hypothetical protein